VRRDRDLTFCQPDPDRAFFRLIQARVTTEGGGRESESREWSRESESREWSRESESREWSRESGVERVESREWSRESGVERVESREWSRESEVEAQELSLAVGSPRSSDDAHAGARGRIGQRCRPRSKAGPANRSSQVAGRCDGWISSYILICNKFVDVRGRSLLWVACAVVAHLAQLELLRVP